MCAASSNTSTSLILQQRETLHHPYLRSKPRSSMHMNNVNQITVPDMESKNESSRCALRSGKRKRHGTDVGPDGSYLQSRKKLKHGCTSAEQSPPAKNTAEITKSSKLHSDRAAARNLSRQRAIIQSSPTKPCQSQVVLDLPVPSTPCGTADYPPLKVSPSPRAVQIPRCNHIRHPAHHKQHYTPLCPACRLGYWVGHLKDVSARIMNQGGLHQWLESSGGPSLSGQSVGGYEDWGASTRGGDTRNTKYIFRDDFGNDISHRHCKKRLHTLLPELEKLAEKEAAWEAENGRAHVKDGALNETVEDFHEHSATIALEKYRSLVMAGSLTQVEQTRNAQTQVSRTTWTPSRRVLSRQGKDVQARDLDGARWQ